MTDRDNLPAPEEMAARLRKRLPEKKVVHCLSVAETLSNFAHDLGIDHDTAIFTALMHDYCRKEAPETLLERAQQYGLAITPWQREDPKLLHGPLAAEACRREFQVENADIREAIHWHTTGCPGLCRLGQALYAADFSEPLRQYPEAAETRRRYAQEGFDSALLYVAQSKVRMLDAKGVYDPVTREFRDWLRQREAT
jgi:predicted HD superfamily hydrolase involved in NAD metabolism